MEQEILDYFAPKFPIITENALEIISKYLPRAYWNDWMHAFNISKQDDELILDLNLVIAVMNEYNIPGSMDVEKYIYAKLSKSVPNRDKLAAQVEKRGCDLLIPYSKIPTQVFINGKLQTVNIHLELITYVEMCMKSRYGIMSSKMRLKLFALL